MNKIFLLKFIKKEYAKNLIEDGIMFCSLAKSFRDTKEFSKKKLDSEEGKPSDLYVFALEDKDNSRLIPINILVNDAACVFCTMLIEQKDFINNTYTMDYNVFNNLVNDGDKIEDYVIVIIKDGKSFIDMIENSVKKLDLAYKFTKVIYDDHKYIHDYPLFSDEHSFEIYTHKSKIYEEQKEFRFIIQNRENQPLKLSIDTDWFSKENTVCCKCRKDGNLTIILQ